jgi:hypothetical protein
VISWIKAVMLKGLRIRPAADLSGWRGRVVRAVRVLGPYAVIELLLPGGSLIALLLWLYQSQKKRAASRKRSAVSGQSPSSDFYGVGERAPRQVPLPV